MSEQNKLIKMVTDSAVLVGLTAGVGYLAKKILKENFRGDPSSNVMNYAKFTGVSRGFYGNENLSGRSENTSRNLFKMASIAIMLGGAVLTLPKFIGGSYLAKYLSGTKLIKNGRDMIKLWRNIRRTTRNIRKIGKSYSIGRNKTDMKMR